MELNIGQMARALVVYGLGWLANRLAEPVSLKWQHVLGWSGLRGAISLALALSLPKALGSAHTQLHVMAFGIVLFTLLVQATTIAPSGPTTVQEVTLESNAATPQNHDEFSTVVYSNARSGNCQNLSSMKLYGETRKLMNNLVAYPYNLRIIENETYHGQLVTFNSLEPIFRFPRSRIDLAPPQAKMSIVWGGAKDIYATTDQRVKNRWKPQS